MDDGEVLLRERGALVQHRDQRFFPLLWRAAAEPDSAEVVAHRADVQQDLFALAIGDGRNDLEMLRWAARGVAMGQAPAEVKEAADEVTGSVLEDGAAAALATLPR